MALTRTQLRDALLLALGREVPGSATTVEQGEVVRAINSGLQRLWLAASHRFLRQSISVTLVAGQATYALTATAQEVYGPVRLADGATLRRFDNRGALDDYALEILGSASRTVANGAPWGYLVEHTRNTGAGDDPHAVTLRVSPAPDAAAVTALSPVTVDGVVECLSYDYEDLDEIILPTYTKLGIVFTGLTWNQETNIVLYFVEGAGTPSYLLEGSTLVLSGEETLTLNEVIALAVSSGVVTAALDTGVMGTNYIGYTEDAGEPLTGGSNSSTPLPVPEGYAETYLLPLARFEITRSHLFSRTELVPRFEADAQAALAALGVAEVAAAQAGDVGAETPTARALRQPPRERASA